MNIFEPNVFKSSEFLEANKALVDRYIKLKALGKTSRAALRSAFGDAYADIPAFQAYCENLECTPYYLRSLPLALATVKANELWSPMLAATNLLALASDNSTKCSTRLAAMKELNVLFECTLVDEKGNTRATGRSLSDFYRDVSEQRSRHPEPGTPEAAAIIEGPREGGIATRH